MPAILRPQDYERGLGPSRIRTSFFRPTAVWQIFKRVNSRPMIKITCSTRSRWLIPLGSESSSPQSTGLADAGPSTRRGILQTKAVPTWMASQESSELTQASPFDLSGEVAPLARDFLERQPHISIARRRSLRVCLFGLPPVILGCSHRMTPFLDAPSLLKCMRARRRSKLRVMA